MGKWTNSRDVDTVVQFARKKNCQRMFKFFSLLISNRREKEFKPIGHAFQQFGKTLGNMKLDHMNILLSFKVLRLN